MPDRPPENPAQPEHIRRSGTASSIFQPKAMPSKSGRSVRRPSLRRREGCRRPRPKQTAYHPPEARREAPCPPPHSRPAAKKRRTEEVVGSAEASYVPAGGRTAHSSGHRRRTIACRCSPATRQRDFRPDQRSRIPSSGRHETTDGPGSAQSGNIAIFILRNRLCSVQIAARCGIGEVVSPEEALSGKSTGTPAIAARLPRTSARHRHVSTCRPPEGGGLPKPAASDRTTIPPVRPRPTVLYRTRRRSRHFCRRASTSATQRTFHPSYRRTRTFDNRQTAPPSFAPSERKSSIREEGTAPPDTVSIRSGALPPSSPSARRFGLRFKQSGKNKSKPPAPYHRRLSRFRPSTHTRPRPVTSNGKQRKQGRPTNLLPPLPENLLFGENTKTVTIEKRLSEIRQTASFRSGSGTTRK